MNNDLINAAIIVLCAFMVVIVMMMNARMMRDLNEKADAVHGTLISQWDGTQNRWVILMPDGQTWNDPFNTQPPENKNGQ